MHKLINDFEFGIFIWQILIIAFVVFLFYMLYLLFKFLRKNV